MLDTVPDFVITSSYGHKTFENEFVLVFETKTPANQNIISNKYCVLSFVILPHVIFCSLVIVI